MQWQALIYIKTKSVPSRAECYFISVALWYMHFLLVLGRFRDWCCLIHYILFSLASLLLPKNTNKILPTLIHIYVSLTSNNQNFKALEFLTAKFCPEKIPFLICYNTYELLELFFFPLPICTSNTHSWKRLLLFFSAPTLSPAPQSDLTIFFESLWVLVHISTCIVSEAELHHP